MSFFFKSDSDDNLQYDDTAFMHFSIAASLVTSLVFFLIIVRQKADQSIKGINRIRKLPLFKAKIQNTNRKTKSYFTTFAFIWKFIVILLALTYASYCYTQAEASQKMIGFDPYEILGVDIDAPVNTIKKAYRKLAIKYHPDKNQNNPEAQAKFIQISKAYQCLTDEKAKQNCAKYGNPDGEVSFKVGIGLPAFMVKAGNQYILIPIFIILLVVIPRSFLVWSNRQKPTDQTGNLLANYPILHKFFTPRFSILNCPVLMGHMKELDEIFPNKNEKVPQDKVQWFKSMLLQTAAVPSQEFLNNIEPHILYRCYVIYLYMSKGALDERISDTFPQLSHKLILFSKIFAQRMMEGQFMGGNPEWPIMWCGMQPTKNLLFFTLQMYNAGKILGQVKSIEFLDLTKEQVQIAQNNPIENIHKELHTEEGINKYIQIFPQANRNYIKQQIQCLPCFEVVTRALLGDQQVKQMTVDDYATLQVKIKRARPTSGFLCIVNFPNLIKETFYLALSYNGNLMYFSDFTQDDFVKDELVFNIQHRQPFEKEMKFLVEILFPYPQMNLKSEIILDVLASPPDTKVIINDGDKQIQKIPKNFWESLASLEAYNQSDHELSDGSETDEEDEEPVKKKNKFVEQTQKGCCDGCDH